MANEAKDLLCAIYGGKSFVKIYQALEIDKIKFSFAEKGKENEGITCWMNAEDFASDLIKKIRTGRLEKQIIEEKKRFEIAKKTDPNEKYPKEVWKSRPGMGKDGLRSFAIQPGSVADLMFRATQNKKSITVGCDYRELELLEYRWSFLEKDYEKKLFEKYTIATMKSDYRGNLDLDEDNPNPEQNIPDENTSSSADSNEQPIARPPVYTAEANDEPESKETPDKNVATENTQSATLKLKLKVIVPITDYKNGKCLKAVTEDGEELPVLFPSDTFKKTNNWDEFEKKASNTGTVFSCEGAILNGKVYVKTIA